MTCADADDPCAPPDELDGKQTMKVFLFLPKPADTLAAGYNRIAIERSKHGPNGPWVDVTKTKNEIVIELLESAGKVVGKHNYWYITDAEPDWLFRPVLRSSTGAVADIVQLPRQAQSIEYEAVLTIEEMKRIYLFGIDLTDDEGTPFPDELFAHFIRTGISQIEHELDLGVLPKVVEDEHYDYWLNDHRSWGFLQLFNRPVISVEKLAIAYPGATTPFEFPLAWVRPEKWSGQLTIVPTSGSFTSQILALPGTHSLMSGAPFIPDIIRVSYTHGFELGKVPAAIKDVCGKQAAFGPLNIAGDLVAGAGLAAKSISIDGLSQSITTSNSSTNAGYGARLINYGKELKGALKTLKSYYKGGRMTAV